MSLKLGDKNHKGKLFEKFIVPPFSILDSKQKYWKDGKSKWDKYNIKSELGRTTSGVNTFEDLHTHPRNADTSKAIAKVGSRSIFDPFLTEIMYRWFCPDYGKILDPFAGGSVRGIVANELGYLYDGIELREEQVKENKKQVNKNALTKPNWIIGDSFNINKLTDKQYDMIFSCPPYYNLEVYSDEKGELSNMETYEEFINRYKQIVKSCVNKLKNNRFAVFVVSDVRDKDGFYRNFVGDTKTAFIEAGMKLYNDIIFLTAIGGLPLRVGIPMASYRKVGRAHQNILVFYKGDIKQIKQDFSQKVNKE